MSRLQISYSNANPAAQLALVASFLVAGYFLAFDAADYLRSVTAAVYGRLWPSRHWLFIHIAAGSVALVTGAIQLSLAYFRRTTTAHRWVGRVYVANVLVSCIASLAVLLKGSTFGPAWVALLTTLSLSALLFTALGLREALRRRWRSHAPWMIRSYMAMMVFAWFRLAWELPVLTGTALSERAPMILGLTMLVTLGGTEFALRSLHRRTA